MLPEIAPHRIPTTFKTASVKCPGPTRQSRLQEITVCFQRLPLSDGGSTRHARDMECDGIINPLVIAGTLWMPPEESGRNVIVWRLGISPRSKMHDLQKLHQELKDTRQEVRNLTVMAMAPHLLPREVEIVRQLERSARAEVKLRLKHLEWVLSQKPPRATRKDRAVDCTRCSLLGRAYCAIVFNGVGDAGGRGHPVRLR